MVKYYLLTWTIKLLQKIHWAACTIKFRFWLDWIRLDHHRRGIANKYNYWKTNSNYYCWLMMASQRCENTLSAFAFWLVKTEDRINFSYRMPLLYELQKLGYLDFTRNNPRIQNRDRVAYQPHGRYWLDEAVKTKWASKPPKFGIAFQVIRERQEKGYRIIEEFKLMEVSLMCDG